MLAENERTHEVVRGDGSKTPHEGWLMGSYDDYHPNYGWTYPAPVGKCCHVCGEKGDHVELVLFAATAVGGRHSMIWSLLCPVCDEVHEFPATETATDEYIEEGRLMGIES